MPVSFALKPRYYAAIQAVFGWGRSHEQPRFDNFTAALIMMGFTPVASNKLEAYCLEVPQEWQHGEGGRLEVPVPKEVCAWWIHEYICIAQQLEAVLGWSGRNFIEILEEEQTSDAIIISF
ncbi:hypothetical protein C8Q78DRAFT_1080571 [Trametes maxima]|nr:hypothetical protein C8Q78DRAFT_1080571 [Trametes maxima]